MKCPKCGYLGFEEVDQCRNCGYQFSLAQPFPLPELAIRREGGDFHPLEDLNLVTGHTSLGNGPSFANDAPVSSTSSGSPTPELPLFGGPITDDVPLITKVSPPRPPLAVRRATPEVPRLKSDIPRTQTLDLDLEPAQPAQPRYSTAHRFESDVRPIEDASLASRFVAVAVDLFLLAVVDLVVIYLTMQICGLTLSDLDLLPKGPLIVFLLVQNGGYLVAFTAGGQTLGKMAAGIRVVPFEENSTLDLGRAAVRTLMWFVLAVPAGLGFLSALFSEDHRGIHDRFSGTRVVRA